MTKFTVIKILLVFLLGSVSANRLFSQELPKLKEGYVDINVLQAQVDQNTEDIRQIKSTLKLNASDQVKSPPKIGDGVFLGPPPAAITQFGPWFWQPSTVNSTVSSPFTIDFPITVQTQTLSPVTTIVSESLPIQPFAPEFSRLQSVTVQEFQSGAKPNARPAPLLQRRNRITSAKVPQCRIINGRKSCN